MHLWNSFWKEETLGSGSLLLFFKTDRDYLRFQDLCFKVNDLIKKTKVHYYSSIIRGSRNDPRMLSK